MEEGLFENRLYYRLRRKDSHARTLLFIHGLSGSSSAWLPFEEIFETEYSTLSVDLRGHGKSHKWDSFDDYTIEHQAGDIKRLLESLHLQDIVLISHSFGTLVALELLRTSQQFIASIFIAPNFEIHRGFRALMSEVPARVSAALAQILPMLRVEGEQIDYEKYRGTGDWSIRRMAADIPNTGLHPYFYSLEQAYKYSEHANWKDVHVPTLIIHGQNDTVIPVASVQKLAGDIGAHLTIVPGANHILVLNNIPEVADQIKEFLKTLKKPAK